MDNLAKCLRYYVADRLTNDPGWRNITVFLSDASVPGEGEHKIMDYIRRQRGQPNHDPNTHHCLCGADADLIMLGLATHEPNFTIIREEFKPNKPRPCALCSQMGHEIKDCQGLPREKQGEVKLFIISESALTVSLIQVSYLVLLFCFSSMMSLQTPFQYPNRSSYSSDWLCYESIWRGS